MSIFVSDKDSKARMREAEHARRNRLEIVKARSQGQISRRDLMKAGLVTAGGLLVPISGLSVFAKSAYAQVPTGTPRSPVPTAGDKPWTQPMLRLHNLQSHPLTSTGGPDAQLLWPSELGEAPAMRRANTTTIRHTVNLANASNTGNVSVQGTTGPMEGRPPGEAFAHQRWDEMVNGYQGKAGLDGEVSHPFAPVGFLMSLGQIGPGLSYSLANNWPAQGPSKVWTNAEGKFARGGFPALLLQARYGESVINRISNNLPFFDPQFGSSCFPDCANTTNGGFGRQEPAIHNHNGHNGNESDGAQNAHFFPGEYYDYHYSLMLARRDAGLKDSLGRSTDTRLGVKRGDPRCSTPTNDGDIIKIPGDFREIQGTLWFHDHRISFTSENVYKGSAALLEYFSGTDRGYERPGLSTAADAVNLRLPSGWRNGKTWGNRDFDIYLVTQDVAFDRDAQLYFDIFTTDGMLGDVQHVNYQWKPNLDVLPRKYRFRTLSGGMSRWVKLAISDSLDPGTANPVLITQIANCGNINPVFVRDIPELDIQGTAERYDFVIDFSKFPVGKKLYLVNLALFSNGKGPDAQISIRQSLSAATQALDPCVGAIMQFTVASQVESVDEPGAMNTIANSCGANDMSLVNDPGADWEIPTIEPVRTRTIEFVSGADGGGLPFDHLSGPEPWGVKVNGVHAYHADMRRVSNLPRPGDTEQWNIIASGGWGHPVHLHFEESKTIFRSTGLHPTEKNMRKDVWHIGNVLGKTTNTNSKVTFQVTFGEFGGAYVNHCHNTVHEDSAMLLRYDLIKGNSNAGIQDVHITVLPTPNPRPEGVTYVDSCYLAEGNPQKFNTGVDVCASPDIGETVLSNDPRTL